MHPGDGLRGQIYPGEGSGKGAKAGEAGGVHAADPPAGGGVGRSWVCASEGFWGAYSEDDTEWSSVLTNQQKGLVILRALRDLSTIFVVGNGKSLEISMRFGVYAG